MNRSIHGLKSWLLQRLSAVYLLVYLVYFLAYMLVAPWRGYEAWRAWLALPAVNVATLAFFTAVLLHAWIGLRDVVMDYVHPFAWRMTVLVLTGGALLSMALWVFLIMMTAGAWRQ